MQNAFKLISSHVGLPKVIIINSLRWSIKKYTLSKYVFTILFYSDVLSSRQSVFNFNLNLNFDFNFDFIFDFNFDFSFILNVDINFNLSFGINFNLNLSLILSLNYNLNFGLNFGFNFVCNFNLQSIWENR